MADDATNGPNDQALGIPLGPLVTVVEKAKSVACDWAGKGKMPAEPMEPERCLSWPTTVAGCQVWAAKVSLRARQGRPPPDLRACSMPLRSITAGPPQRSTRPLATGPPPEPALPAEGEACCNGSPMVDGRTADHSAANGVMKRYGGTEAPGSASCGCHQRERAGRSPRCWGGTSRRRCRRPGPWGACSASSQVPDNKGSPIKSRTPGSDALGGVAAPLDGPDEARGPFLRNVDRIGKTALPTAASLPA